MEVGLRLEEIYFEEVLDSILNNFVQQQKETKTILFDYLMVCYGKLVVKGLSGKRLTRIQQRHLVQNLNNFFSRFETKFLLEEKSEILVNVVDLLQNKSNVD